jgi:Family of unknown function (DUF6244)
MATSETESIANELQQVFGVINAGKGAAMAAVDKAGQVVQQATAAGFIGVAQRMNAIQSEIKTIHAMLGNATQTGQPATASLRAVNDKMSPQEATGHLNAAKGQLSSMRSSLHGVAQKVADTMAQVQAALQGGQPGPLLAMLNAVRQHLVSAAQHVDATTKRIDATIAKSGQLGN